jgi:peptidyl-dipeptidase A
VLCNVRADERWAGTMLHEYGHAIYDLEIDRRLPWAVRTPPHAASTEAIAMLFGRLSKDEAWLVPHLGLSPAEARAIETATRTAFAEGMLVLVRWVLVMTRFERALYADPDRDLDALWWDLVERFQRVRRPDGRRAPDWAAKIHVATAPVYYHSYLMGEAIASQVSHAIRAKTGRGLVDNPAAGAWLRDRYFKPGARERWDLHLASSTDGPLDPGILLADMGIAA